MLHFRVIEVKKAVSIRIYPYRDCYERAIDYLTAEGYTAEDFSRVDECEILFNVPFSVMGCNHRAIIGTDLKKQRCAYLCPTGYKVPEIFFEVVNDS